jgi:hypothetical protein
VEDVKQESRISINGSSIYLEEIVLITGLNANRIIAILLCIVFAGFHVSPAKDKKMKPEELIAEHLRSIGNSDLLSQTKSRAFVGTTNVRFVQGAIGELNGQCQFASEGDKLGIILKYVGQDYRGEHFAFDGKDVTVGRYLPGRISTLAEFINRFNDLMKKGLLGGALNVDWPLQTLQEIQPKLKYKKAKLAGNPMHSLEYRPSGGLEGFRIVFFFEPETFHHVKTEYKLRISAGMGGGPATGVGIERPDSYYLLSEDFADFKEADGITLPHSCTIRFSSEGQTRTFVAYWTLEAQQWFHNAPIDPDLFRAAVY